MEEGLTKKEKRALAKENKKKEQNRGSFTKYLKYLVVGLVVIGGTYLLFRPTSGPTGSDDLQEKFVEYARNIGLDETKFKEDLAGEDVSTKVSSDLSEANSAGLNSTPTFVLDGEKIPNPASVEEFATLVQARIDDGQPGSVMLTGDDHYKGNPDAQVVLIEYSDFQCPACRAYIPIITSLIEQFPDDLVVVYRHFPLQSVHANARAAAEASEAAAKQGKFWEFHDILFDKQTEWSRL